MCAIQSVLCGGQKHAEVCTKTSTSTIAVVGNNIIILSHPSPHARAKEKSILLYPYYVIFWIEEEKHDYIYIWDEKNDHDHIRLAILCTRFGYYCFRVCFFISKETSLYFFSLRGRVRRMMALLWTTHTYMDVRVPSRFFWRIFPFPQIGILIWPQCKRRRLHRKHHMPFFRFFSVSFLLIHGIT